MNRQKSMFQSKSQEISKPVARSPLAEISDSRHLQITSAPQSKRITAEYVDSSNNYDENQKDKFELMNIKIIVYGLTGLVCEEEPSKKKLKFSKKQMIFPKTFARRDIKPLNSYDITDVDYNVESRGKKALDITTAVVSCQKNGASNDISFETFLPSLPLGNPVATSLNKVNYDAAWTSEQSILQQDDGAKDRSAFAVTRCMKQATFKPGVGARSNYCHQTIELAININRGTELIRLGTASIVVNGEEEGEVEMNVTTTPFLFKSKKLKKKKSKYGYFSNDSSKRFYLDKNSVLKVGVQVVPEDAMRFAREKEKKKEKNESVLNELLEQDQFKTLLEEMSNNDLNGETMQNKGLLNDQMEKDSDGIPEHRGRTNAFPPYVLCGSLPTSWVPNFFNRPNTEPEIPKEVIANENFDQFVIRSLISSVSEMTDGSDTILQGKKEVCLWRVCIKLSCISH